MVSQNPAIRPTGLESIIAVQKSAVAGMRAVLRMRAMLAAAIVVALALTRSATAHAATITVDSLADTGAVLTCALRDAITAANTMTAINGCAAGTGHDTIRFSVTGTILLASTLPQVTDSRLTIKGPASPGITIDGDNAVQVMQVASGATLNLKRLTIYGGVSELLGGGVHNSGTLNVSNSTFSSNQSGTEGGAIYNDGSLTVTNTTFSGNSARPFGFGRGGVGGAIANDGTMEITNSTFSANFALASGGAIENTGTLTVTNSTFSDNSTSTAPLPGNGGGIQNSGSLTVTNSTFSGNGGGPGGGISNTSFASIKNTIVAMSSGGLVPPSNCFGTIIDAGYNISDDSSCGFSATGSLNSTDPKLDPAGLNNNGGPTQTIALVVGSPAIDAIPLDSCTDQAGNPLTTDQRGFARPDAGEDVCDIGAYESQETFAGQPRTPNCHGVSVSALVHEFGNMNAAASALGFHSVNELQDAIRAFCGRPHHRGWEIRAIGP